MTFLDHAKKAAKVLEQAMQLLEFHGTYRYSAGVRMPDDIEAECAVECQEALTSANALVELLENGGWMPIESAPKDCVYIGIIEYAEGKYGEPFMCEWSDEYGHICQFQTELVPHRPTHWMPLPTPPKQENE